MQSLLSFFLLFFPLPDVFVQKLAASLLPVQESFQLPAVEPDAVRLALINDDTTARPEVDPVHQLLADRALAVGKSAVPVSLFTDEGVEPFPVDGEDVRDALVHQGLQFSRVEEQAQTGVAPLDEELALHLQVEGLKRDVAVGAGTGRFGLV